MYNIKEFSKLTGIPASSLRYYEELGILKDVKRDKNGIRIYDDCDRAKINSIICFKESGMTLSNIQKFFCYEDNLSEDIDKVIDLIDGQEEILEQKIREMTLQLEHIRHTSRYYHGIKKAIDEDTKWPCYDDV